MSPQIQKIMAFEKEIKEYEDLRRKYQTLIINKMDREEYIKYNEVLFSTHSCAIEGNSFSVKSTKMATGVAILRIFYDILHVLISFETLFQSI